MDGRVRNNENPLEDHRCGHIDVEEGDDDAMVVNVKEVERAFLEDHNERVDELVELAEIEDIHPPTETGCH